MSVDSTPERILMAAMQIILSQGVKKTNLEEIAAAAGVTRVTVYRYFGDKQRLIREMCRRIAAIFQRAARGSDSGSVSEVDARLKQLGNELSQLPSGNLLACLNEVSRLYPEVYEEFRATRQEAIDRLFQQALDAATRERALREGLNLQVLKAIFWAAVVGLIENPTLIYLNVSFSDVFSTVTEVFRHGILKPEIDGANHEEP